MWHETHYHLMKGIENILLNMLNISLNLLNIPLEHCVLSRGYLTNLVKYSLHICSMSLQGIHTYGVAFGVHEIPGHNKNQTVEM